VNAPLSPPANGERPRDHVTSTLAKRILSGALAPGDRLPTEAELSTRLGVSRTALREALRMLAAKGLIESRTRAGTVVSPRSNWNHLDPDLLALREELEPDLDFVSSLIEARRVVEPAAAAFAAQRATGEDLHRIEDAFNAMSCAAQGDVEAFVAADEAFHIGVLLASRNPVFATFGGIIGSALRSAFRLTTSVEENHAATLALHRDVLEAIRLRRPDEARDLMARVIDAASGDLARFMATRSDG
jgi:DNA-binding FadR family transcriptional regulator